MVTTPRWGHRPAQLCSRPELGRTLPIGEDGGVPQRDDYDDSPGRALVHAMVAVVAMAALVGGSVGLAVVAAAKMGGLSGGGSASGAQRETPPSLYMPPYKPTEDAGNGLDVPSPAASPPSLPGGGGGATTSSKPKPSQITLFVAPQQVNPGQRINFNGVYPGGEGATLQVQRREGGSWIDFPVTASVRGGSFETWIQTSRTGKAKFRVFDSSANKGSNVVAVGIG